MAPELILLSALLACAHCSANYILETFSDTTDFSHMVVHRRTGRIYIGAVNNIYQLASNLTLEKHVQTGPSPDNPKCLSPPKPCKYERTNMDSYTKAMVIDYGHRRLIICSNLYLGQCHKRKLSDINKKDPGIYPPMVPNDKQSKCVVLIAPGPTHNKDALYIAATRSTVGISAYRDLVPAIATRNLETFKLAVSSTYDKSKKEMEAQQRDVFFVDYIFGFSSKGFNYFLTVQKENTELSENVKYVSRIVRICQKDQGYLSYTEVPLECSFRGKFYNLVQTATVGKVGDDLSQSLGMRKDEDALFALFSASQKNKIPTNDSVLCIYSVRRLMTYFTENIQKCFEGIGNVGPAHFVRLDPCRKSVSSQIVLTLMRSEWVNLNITYRK